MFNPATLSEGQFRNVSDVPDLTIVTNAFKVLHGYYGNLFLSKFASGVLDGAGRDMGVASARSVWAHGMARYDESTVMRALERCRAAHPEFPPSLPQFLALCDAAAPRGPTADSTKLLGVSPQLRSRWAANARAINEKHDAKGRRGNLVREAPGPGLGGLFQAVAEACALAGGDEVQELRRLEGWLIRPAGRAAA